MPFAAGLRERVINEHPIVTKFTEVFSFVPLDQLRLQTH
jgi:hypothetical protein